jgi:superfamily I DNA/RNA helicase
MVSQRKVDQVILSHEQEDALSQDGDLKIQAFAGCGKSTYLLHYLIRHPHEQALYVSYSRPNTIAFAEKCNNLNIGAEVKTFHSLAKNQVFGRRPVKIEEKGNLSVANLKKFLADELRGIPENKRNTLALHAKKFLAGYCNTTLTKIDEFNYWDTVDRTIATNLHGYHDHVLGLARRLAVLMHSQKIPISHDFYLKLFHVQSKKTVLPFNTILVDEVQDTTPCMLDIIDSQKSCRKIYVGDMHQDIYGWRGASRAMTNLPCKEMFLRESYRFGPTIAAAANQILGYKTSLRTEHPNGEVVGKGPNKSVKGEAFISRTLSGVLKNAIRWTESKLKGKIGFLGDIKHYMYTEDGASLKDVYNLFVGKTPYDPFIASFDSFESLEWYARDNNDTALLNFIDIVNQYQHELIFLLSNLEKRCVDSSIADLILTTSHKAKGCEFKKILLCNDYKDILKLLRMPLSQRPPDSSINEEINIIYTAITRASDSFSFYGNKLS